LGCAFLAEIAGIMMSSVQLNNFLFWGAPTPIIHGAGSGSGRLRMRRSAIAQKAPVQSSRPSRTPRIRCMSRSRPWGGMRRRITPQEAGRWERKASSPKSLSNVSRTRCSATARFRTVWSSAPAIDSFADNTSCPEFRSPRITDAAIVFVRKQAHESCFQAGIG
jgi:hypothetical protein